MREQYTTPQLVEYPVLTDATATKTIIPVVRYVKASSAPADGHETLEQ